MIALYIVVIVALTITLAFEVESNAHENSYHCPECGLRTKTGAGLVAHMCYRHRR